MHARSVLIRTKLMEGKGKGYVTWAKRFNAKQMAKTVLFLQEHKIESYEQLKEMTDERSGRLKELKNSMKEKEAFLSENKKRQQAIIDYSMNRKVFGAYKKSGYSKKFYSDHEAQLIIYKAAEEENAPHGHRDQLHGDIACIDRDHVIDPSEIQSRNAYNDHRHIDDPGAYSQSLLSFAYIFHNQLLYFAHSSVRSSD